MGGRQRKARKAATPGGAQMPPHFSEVAMDQTIVTLIGSLGFPIVMCLLMYRQNLRLTEVVSELKDAITNLTNKILTHNEVYHDEHKANDK